MRPRIVFLALVGLLLAVAPALAQEAEPLAPVVETGAQAVNSLVQIIRGIIGSLVLLKLREKYNVDLGDAAEGKIFHWAKLAGSYAEEKAAKVFKAGMEKWNSGEKLATARAFLKKKLPGKTDAELDELLEAALPFVRLGAAVAKPDPLKVDVHHSSEPKE